MKIKMIRFITLFCALAMPGTVLAHTGHVTGSGFLAGLAHPLTGIDHLVAMLLVGLWASRSRSLQGNLTLISFALFMGMGALLAVNGIGLPGIETMIALSVLVMGLIMITGVRMESIGTLLIAFFALFHGQAHMLEMTTLASPAIYAIGFMLSTAVLLSAGLGAGIWLQRMHCEWMLRGAGLVSGGFGALLLLGAN